MHKSKLAGFIVDCQTGDINAAADFWGGALGMQTRHFPAQQGQKYVRLLDPDEALHIEVQSVSHASRVHLDIETDNINAEVERLEALGAKKIRDVKSWCVMEAPTGQRFCVVNKITPQFDQLAKQWE